MSQSQEFAELARTLPDQDSVHAYTASLGTGGTPPASAPGMTYDEGNGMYRTVFTFVDTPVVLVDEAGVVAYGSRQLFNFPQGLIVLDGATSDLDLTKSSTGVNADWDGDIGLGTAAASNNATLTVLEDDALPTTATPQAVLGVTTGDMVATTAEMGVLKDGTTTTGAAIDLFLNILVDDLDQDVTTTPCNIIVNGTITQLWRNLGDN